MWLVRAKFGDAQAALHDWAPGEHACNRAAQLWLTQRPIEGRSLKRTVGEWAVAKWCTRHWTASEVAQALAEHEYFGRHLRGLAAAAQGYFGKGPEALAPHELALLLGLPQSPVHLSPDCHPERALQRRGFMLDQLRGVGLLSEDQFKNAMAQPLGHIAVACQEGLAP
jgi:membrane peptidoglycan carboxypeptidase